MRSRRAGGRQRRLRARFWDRWAPLLLVLSCGPPPPPSAPSARHEPLASTRRWPEPRRHAPAADGVVVLTPPPPRQLARSAVQAFFEAVRHESVPELSAWLAEDATLASGPGTTPESVTKVWASRFKQLDYGVSGALAPYRADQVGLFTAEELRQLASFRRFALAPQGDEILAVVDTRDRRKLPGPRHFGKRLEFVLAPTTDGYRIRRMFEDHRLP